MFKSRITAFCLSLLLSACAVDITGAGATFPNAVYNGWAEAYKGATGNTLNYFSVGSSRGVQQVLAKNVVFGATDAPIAAADLERDGLIQFPAIIGGTVPVVNLEGFKPGELRITGPVLAEVYLGIITKWNDARLKALNPNKNLPDVPITVVHRADGSGTTYNFTDYLSAVSKDWADKVGKGTAVKWPAASSLGGRGNEGVAANLNRTQGAVAYVQYAYAKQNNLTYLQIQNADGNYVSPDDTTFAAAAVGVDWFSTPGMGVSMVNAKGKDSWPISTASYILMYKKPTDKTSSTETLRFFDWAYKNGRKIATNLDYVPLPDSLIGQIRSKVWAEIK